MSRPNATSIKRATAGAEAAGTENMRVNATKE